MKDRFVVSEETEESVGIELVDEGDSVILRDVDEIDKNEVVEYYIPKEDIPKLIEGLKLFMEE
jgi:hypothetical protein